MELEMIARLLTALFLGIIIGIERQWHQCLAGLRTNVLVAVGACLFVLLEALGDGHSSMRIAAQVVSGIGFLGAGVILREGLTVRGLDTAATLWCSAAVGTLAGSGFLLLAAAGTAVVVAVNSILRPMAKWIDQHHKIPASQKVMANDKIYMQK
ncbi:MgtC/SapB family protein [Bacillus sp. FJAT-42376]|uniref:MgtC/SapB family protein n=1 Tax=Bacillus sp. FJAT-42376 TaxID=2014076 RepID=UPI000F4F40E2|nr:MgtC/SapB family protein [Bacillus sp. FJAT-42376]AZB42099.1 MgtC/SapB family protein [Bacillus sp. FJAT-42376]